MLLGASARLRSCVRGLHAGLCVLPVTGEPEGVDGYLAAEAAANGQVCGRVARMRVLQQRLGAAGQDPAHVRHDGAVGVVQDARAADAHACEVEKQAKHAQR